MISPSGAPFAPVSGTSLLTRVTKLMLALLSHSIVDAVAQAPSETDVRTGVYVMAGIAGLLVSGIISCIKEMQSAKADARAC
jgi:ABC-type Mn2+/Zn2+ transport system permease subunit